MSDTGNYEGARNASCTVIADPHRRIRRKYVFTYLQILFVLQLAGKKARDGNQAMMEK